MSCLKHLPGAALAVTGLVGGLALQVVSAAALISAAAESARSYPPIVVPPVMPGAFDPEPRFPIEAQRLRPMPAPEIRFPLVEVLKAIE
jgi:hypothetical protein